MKASFKGFILSSGPKVLARSITMFEITGDEGHNLYTNKLFPPMGLAPGP